MTGSRESIQGLLQGGSSNRYIYKCRGTGCGVFFVINQAMAYGRASIECPVCKYTIQVNLVEELEDGPSDSKAP